MLLEASGLEKAWGGHPVLRGADLALDQGAHTLISGPSGAGKSTLLHLLGRLAEPDAGSLRFRDQPVSGDSAAWRLAHVGLVFQEILLVESLTVKQNLRLVQTAAGKHGDLGRLLEPLALLDRLNTSTRVLSRGERQRVALARAFANEPALVLADEPTASLDPSARDATLDQLFRLCEQVGATALIVSHDPAVAERPELAGRLHLHGGRLSAEPPAP